MPDPSRFLPEPPAVPALRVRIAQYEARRELVKRELANREILPFVLLTTPGYEVGWVHQEITDLLDAFVVACERKQSPRLIIQLPPRIGKSELVSRKFPPFVLGRHPEWEVVCATYNQDLASDFGREVRSVLLDPVYGQVFPDVHIRPDSNAVDYVKFMERGSYTAVGIGGALTGRGAHVLIIDDPVKNQEDADSELVRENTWKWYQTVARTRLAPGGGIILCLTRWHEMDLAGHLLEQQKVNPGGDRWMVYSYEALSTKADARRGVDESLHPERWPAEEYRKLRATLDPRIWSALYQQNPVPPEGIHFKRDWFQWENGPTEPGKWVWYIATDFAVSLKQTADFTVLWAFGVDEEGRVHFAKPVRGRFQPMEIVEKLCDLMEQYRPVQVAIENVHISKSLGPFLRKRMEERRLYCTLEDMTPSKDKVTRTASLRGRLQQGKILFDKADRADIEPEFLAFPAGRHDDMVDTASMGMMLLDRLLTAPGAPKHEDAPPPWSMEWMQQRIAQSAKPSGAPERKTFRGRPRKKAGEGTWFIP